jgi:hypothetical protein
MNFRKIIPGILPGIAETLKCVYKFGRQVIFKVAILTKCYLQFTYIYTYGKNSVRLVILLSDLVHIIFLERSSVG